MSILTTAKNTTSKAKQTLSRYESDNPHTAGQIRRAVGGVLIADGFVGLENPFDGKKTRPGIVGAMVSVVLGLVFVAVAYFMTTLGPDTDTETTGQVVAVNGSETCSMRAEFVVDGTTYTARSTGQSSTNCDHAPGDTVTVLYDSANPARSTTEEPMLNVFAWVFGGVGVLVAVGGLVTTAIRAASIVFGVTLWRSGSKMIRENPRTADDAGLVEQARQAITRLLTAKGALTQEILGAAQGGAGQRAPGEQPTPGERWEPAPHGGPRQPQPYGQSPQPQPYGQPQQQPGPVVAPSEPTIAGWYLTEDQRHYRWHDGANWTPHTRPVQAPSAPN
ncbi:DUF3592 domain-containing protein [Promicromonospora panici]|uniref:DUF3592 domain-containing protein n=1 Tax=Promicromonospora panici TaxID=2219658 RepID=UPI00101C4600|nr:DUF3592 domain-containing protein [Promicromonospora panici]